MATLSKAQIAAQKANLQKQLAKLAEDEKNFDLKADGFKELDKAKATFDKSVADTAKKFSLTDEDLKAHFAPPALISYAYEKAGNTKIYEWYKGKIGKAPNEFELLKSQGIDSVKTHLTEFGKKWIATETGLKEFTAFATPKTKAEIKAETAE